MFLELRMQQRQKNFDGIRAKTVLFVDTGGPQFVDEILDAPYDD